MNSTNEIAGRALLQAWKDASVELLIEYRPPMRDSLLHFRGKIVSIGPNRIGLSSPDGELELDITDARFEDVGSKAAFEAAGLKYPDNCPEMVAIWSPELDRVVFSVAPEID
jgi:hypothetical protein